MLDFYVCVYHCEYSLHYKGHYGGVREGKRLALVGLDARGEMTSLNRIPERFWDPKSPLKACSPLLCGDPVRLCLPNILALNVVILGDNLSTLNLCRQTSSWLVCVSLDLWVYTALVSGVENSLQSQVVDSRSVVPVRLYGITRVLIVPCFWSWCPWPFLIVGRSSQQSRK